MMWLSQVLEESVLADPALQEMCSKVLVLASHYSLVVRFVEQKNDFHFGRVNNALAAAIDEHLLEYLVRPTLFIGNSHLQGFLRTKHFVSKENYLLYKYAVRQFYRRH